MSRVPRLGFIEPQLPSLADQPPYGEGWLHEIKHDGYRTQLIIDDGRARAITRKGFDWSRRYGRIVQACSNLNCRSAILDGEVIVQDEHGASDFAALLQALQHEPHRLIFYAFDLLHLDGKDLRTLPLVGRRAHLTELVATDPKSPLQFSETFIGDGSSLFEACAEHGLEGIVSKRANSLYRSGGSKSWLKVKCLTESSFVIIGTDRDRKTGAMRALLAKAEEEELSYAGAAFISLSAKERVKLQKRLQELASCRCPLPGLTLKDAQWAKPELVARVRHLASAKGLRHGTVKDVS
jgi:bifunctional non-homologous end joining protein LigD